MPTPGFGAEFGNNFGAGGVIYLTNLSPEPDTNISSSINFTVGVQGGLIDLSTVQITINSQLVFSGFTAVGGHIVNVTSNGEYIIWTESNHGLVTGNQVNIEGALSSSTGAGLPSSPINGVWTITFISPNQFALQGSTYEPGWTGGGLVSLPPSFTLDYLASSYSYSIPDNGYSFVIFSSVPYASQVTITVSASTVDGGTSVQTYQLTAVQPIIYPPMPYGVPLDNISINTFSGEVESPSAFAGLLANGNGQVFFSPALPEPNSGSQIDLDYLETVVRAEDSYKSDPTHSDNNRPWLWGPPLSGVGYRLFPPNYDIAEYYPVWNSWNQAPTTAPFTPLKTTQATATGVFTDVPTGNITIILV